MKALLLSLLTILSLGAIEADAKLFSPGTHVIGLESDAKPTSITSTLNGKYMAWAQGGSDVGKCYIALDAGGYISYWAVTQINLWGGFVAFSPDSNFLVVTSPASQQNGAIVKVMNLRDWVPLTPVAAQSAHEKAYVIQNKLPVLWSAEFRDWSVSHVVITSDNRFVIGACSDNTVRVWNINSGKLRQELPIRQPIKGLAFSSDTKELIVATGTNLRGILQFWDATQGRLKRQVAAFDAIETVLVTQSGRAIVTSNNRGIVTFWNARKGQRVRGVSMKNSATRLKDVTPNGKFLIGLAKRTKGMGYVMTYWDARTGKVQGQDLTCSYGYNRPVAYCPSEKRLVSAGSADDVSKIQSPVITISHLVLN